MNTRHITTLQKKILYKSKYRGTKEADTVISGFVSDNIMNFNNQYLTILNDFLELNDQDILTMVGSGLASDNKYSQIINDILEHKQTND